MCVFSSDTVNFHLPLERRAFRTRRPPGVAERSRKPCLLRRFLFDGWNVRFICIDYFSAKFQKGLQKYLYFPKMPNPQPMHFTFFSNNPESRWLEVRWEIPDNQETELEIQWPAWRPGRYELQNFAQKVGQVTLKGTKGEIKKISKDRWKISGLNPGPVTIQYRFYAEEINAGGSYLSTDFLYLNPINATPYIPSRREEPVTVFLPGTQNLRYAGGLPGKKTDEGWVLEALNYDQWVDSPFLLSTTLQDRTYFVQGVPFTLWIDGHINLDWNTLLPEFEAFTQKQIELFGEFPEPDFHFLLWVVDFPFYHGVEHRNSTMMVLGPATQDPAEFRRELLGLASHELFHVWNICKIRPKELLPYDYSRENYFNTCFIAEGITTYYGDEMLRRATVFTQEEYVKELETICRRHFETAEPAELSLLDSSIDLWMDGYRSGVPFRKVSVYHKGALVALILDHWIRQFSQESASLDTVMQHMWKQFGKTQVGYTYTDYQEIIASLLPENSTQNYFSRFIEGTESLWEPIQEVLHQQGLPRLIRTPTGKVCFDLN